MAPETDTLHQAISRALRDNLGAVQRATDELNQAVGDLLAACSSNRPAHTLLPMLRAQTAAASLGAVLDVLSRFVAGSLASAQRAGTAAVAVPAVTETPAVARPEPQLVPAPSVPLVVSEAEPPPEPSAAAVTTEEARDMVSEGAPVTVEQPGVGVVRAPMGTVEAPVAEAEEAPAAAAPKAFDLETLPLDQQELHRRAKRVAKVSMQDIKMLRPEQVRLGRENKDLCKRVRDDLEKARKEYERRFQTIMDHPVDYFYDWAVEILADGDPAALGDYPYPRPQTRG